MPRGGICMHRTNCQLCVAGARFQSFMRSDSRGSTRGPSGPGWQPPPPLSADESSKDAAGSTGSPERDPGGAAPQQPERALRRCEFSSHSARDCRMSGTDREAHSTLLQPNHTGMPKQTCFVMHENCSQVCRQMLNACDHVPDTATIPRRRRGEL